MWHGAKIAAIIPAYQEQQLILRTLSGLPSFLDHVIVVDDASADATLQELRRASDPRLITLRHAQNRGVGASIVTGYRHALELGAEILVVLAADNQMDPGDLPALLAPLVAGSAEYVKGNRFVHAEARNMPWPRRLAGRFTSLLTRLTTGLRVDDCQCGYTALHAEAARKLPLEELWPRYGYPNDLLALLALADCRVAEVPVRPVYAGEKSGVRAWHVLTIAYLLSRRFWQKLYANPALLTAQRKI